MTDIESKLALRNAQLLLRGKMFFPFEVLLSASACQLKQRPHGHIYPLFAGRAGGRLVKAAKELVSSLEQTQTITGRGNPVLPSESPTVGLQPYNLFSHVANSYDDVLHNSWVSQRHSLSPSSCPSASGLEIQWSGPALSEMAFFWLYPFYVPPKYLPELQLNSTDRYKITFMCQALG